MKIENLPDNIYDLIQCLQNALYEHTYGDKLNGGITFENIFYIDELIYDLKKAKKALEVIEALRGIDN